MEVAKFACADTCVDVWYGISILSTVVLDALLILVSYSLILILYAVFHLPSRGA
jgi:hypothetical protein